MVVVKILDLVLSADDTIKLTQLNFVLQLFTFQTPIIYKKNNLKLLL